MLLPHTSQGAEGGCCAVSRPDEKMTKRGAEAVDYNAWYEQYSDWYSKAFGVAPVSVPAKKQKTAGPASSTTTTTTTTGGGVKSGAAAKNEILTKIEEATTAMNVYKAIQGQCASLNNSTAVEALFKIANVGTMKFRQELVKQQEIVRLGDRIKGLLKSNACQPFELMSKAVYAVSKMGFLGPNDKQVLEVPTAWAMKIPEAQYVNLPSNGIGRFFWGLARAEVVNDANKKDFLKKMVKEASDPVRVRQLDLSVLSELLHAVAQFRTLKHGKQDTIHVEASDERLFAEVAKRVIANVDSMTPNQLVNICHNFAEIGIRNEELFNIVCPALLKRKDEIRAEEMARVVQAYARFQIPLREQAQGFRNVAIVAKGDFLRPSEKPKGRKKFTYERPDVDWASTTRGF